MPATRRTRMRALAEQAAGQPVSPLQELPATTRSTKATKPKKPSKKTTTEPPSETNTFPTAVTPSVDTPSETLPQTFSRNASEVPSELPSEIASEVSTELSSGSSEVNPEVSMKIASEVVSENSSSSASDSSVVINPPVASDTAQPTISTAAPSQKHALIHIWLEPTAPDLESGHSESKPSITLTVPIPTLDKFLASCKQEPYPVVVAAPASSIQSGSSAAGKGKKPFSFQRMTRARTAELMMNDAATQILPKQPPSKRKLDDEDLLNQPSAKRSRISKPDSVVTQPSTNRPNISRPRPIRKVRAELDKATGRVKGLTYTVEGQLVLDPYQADVVIENSDDECIPFDSERVGFFDVPDALRKRFTKNANPDESQPKENALPVETQQRSDTHQMPAVTNNLSSPVPSSQNQSKVENENIAMVRAEANNQPPTPVQSTPSTSRPTREWGLSSLARSVSRFVPQIPSFRRRRSTVGTLPTLDEVSPPIQTVQDPSMVTATTPTITTKHVSKQATGLIHNTKTPQVRHHSQHRSQTEPRRVNTATNENDNSGTSVFPPKNKRSRNWKSLRQLKSEEEEKRRQMVLAYNKRLIESEVIRKVTAAMRETERQRKADEPNETGQKRKRYSPEIIPNPIGTSYGMDLDFFTYSSDEEEPEQPTPSRPSKRVRFESEAPSTPPRQIIGDPHQPTPYTGAEFADPTPNVFKALDEQTPTMTFTVPSDSEGESDEDGSPSSATTTQAAPNESVQTTAESESWTQPPPPRPNPPHADLPATNTTSSDQDALARARSQALRYTPKQPSGLRASSRLSNSTVASEIGSEPDLDMVPGNVAVDQDQPGPNVRQNQPELSFVQDQSESSVVQEQMIEEGLDFEVAHELDCMPKEGLIKFVFPNSPTHVDASLVDPEVQAALDHSEVQASLDSLWKTEDEGDAEQFVETQFSAWEAQYSSEISRDLSF